MIRESLVTAVLASTVLLAGCADGAGESVLPAQSGPSPTASSGTGPIPVLAATDVYGDIARQIGGDRVAVTSILGGESQDPHSYEATARDQLAVSAARVVIVNGGHYDEFMTRLLSASPAEPTVLTAVDIAAGHGDEAQSGDVAHEETGGQADEEAHADGDADDQNEHVWYDLSAMDALAAKLAATLSEVEPGSQSTFEQNYDTFSAAISGLQQKADELRTAHEGEDVAVTEIVAGWLLEECGLENRTPAEFTEAIEEGSDVPARVLQETLTLMSGDMVRALIYNEQTTGPQTDRLRQAAQDAGIPIVHVRESLPAGSGYLEWIDNTINAVRNALE